VLSHGSAGTARAVRQAMVRSALVLILVSSTAFATPMVGVSIGITQDQTNSSQDPNRTESLFARIGILSRLSAELNLAKTETNDSTSNHRLTGYAVLDLGSSDTWVPQLFAGAGVDYASDNYGNSVEGHHFDGGLGFEYRATGGLTIGARFHLGGRSIDSDNTGGCCVAYVNGQQNLLVATEFRTLEAYAGIRF
jgi:hypothetical protein